MASVANIAVESHYYSHKEGHVKANVDSHKDQEEGSAPVGVIAVLGPKNIEVKASNRGKEHRFKRGFVEVKLLHPRESQLGNCRPDYQLNKVESEEHKELFKDLL